MSDQYDDEERRLAEALRRATPDPPAGVARAEAARRYARRARRAKGVLAVGAAAAVVAAIVVVPTVLSSGSGSDQATGPTKTAPNPQSVHPFVCPPAAQASGRGPQPPHGILPTGAVLARICPIEPNVDHWVAPRQALVTGLDHLAAYINELPKTRPLPCPGPMGTPQYTLTLEYPGGHLASVTGQVGSCDLLLAGVLRKGASPLLATYLGMLGVQQAAASAGASPPDSGNSSCLPGRVVESSPTTVVLARDAIGSEGATVCGYAFPSANNLTSKGKIDAGQLAKLNADIRAHASHTPPPGPAYLCRAQRAIPTGILITRLQGGDRMDLVGDTCHVFAFFDRDGMWYWRPSEPILRMLDGALHIVEPSLPLARLSGRLLVVGGPAGTPSRPLTGTVRITLVGGGGFDKTVNVGASGRFHLSVPAGRYRLIGYSPWYFNGHAGCSPAPPVVKAKPGRAVTANVYCQEN